MSSLLKHFPTGLVGASQHAANLASAQADWFLIPLAWKRLTYQPHNSGYILHSFTIFVHDVITMSARMKNNAVRIFFLPGKLQLSLEAAVSVLKIHLNFTSKVTLFLADLERKLELFLQVITYWPALQQSRNVINWTYKALLFSRSGVWKQFFLFFWMALQMLLQCFSCKKEACRKCYVRQGSPNQSAIS